MPFYEITFETGRTSVACYEDEAEALSACGEQHRRAVSGEPGGPLGVPAERIKVIREYDKHPSDFNVDQTMSAEVLNKEVEGLIKALADDNGVVFIPALSMHIQHLTHPMVQKENAFDSNFAMKEKKTLKFDFDKAGA